LKILREQSIIDHAKDEIEFDEDVLIFFSTRCDLVCKKTKSRFLYNLMVLSQKSSS